MDREFLGNVIDCRNTVIFREDFLKGQLLYVKIDYGYYDDNPTLYTDRVSNENMEKYLDRLFLEQNNLGFYKSGKNKGKLGKVSNVNKKTLMFCEYSENKVFLIKEDGNILSNALYSFTSHSLKNNPQLALNLISPNLKILYENYIQVKKEQEKLDRKKKKEQDIKREKATYERLKKKFEGK